MHKGPCGAGVLFHVFVCTKLVGGLGNGEVDGACAHLCVCVHACVRVHACIGVCVCTGTPVCTVCMGTCGRQRSILGVVPQESLALILSIYFFVSSIGLRSPVWLG